VAQGAPVASRWAVVNRRCALSNRSWAIGSSVARISPAASRRYAPPIGTPNRLRDRAVSTSPV
jgi:hypothetical protein